MVPFKQLYEQGHIPHKELIFSVRFLFFFTAQYLQWRKGDASTAQCVGKHSMQHGQKLQFIQYETLRPLWLLPCFLSDIYFSKLKASAFSFFSPSFFGSSATGLKSVPTRNTNLHQKLGNQVGRLVKGLT